MAAEITTQNISSAIARSYYSSSIADFLVTPLDEILGRIMRHNEFEVLPTQRTAWVEQIKILKTTLKETEGWLHFEFIVPRMGHRIDVVLIIDHIVFPLEFKVGETRFHARDREQVWDYGLDLKNFHESSHSVIVAPILCATDATEVPPIIQIQSATDLLIEPLAANAASLRDTINQVLTFSDGIKIDTQAWALGRYSPTPTILEAARALYNGHGVEAISRSDATATNLSKTSECIEKIIQSCRTNKQTKSHLLCYGGSRCWKNSCWSKCCHKASQQRFRLIQCFSLWKRSPCANFVRSTGKR